MIGVAASYSHPSAGLDEVLDVYVHGYISARMMNMSRKAEESSSSSEGIGSGAGGSINQVNGEDSTGLPVTVSATIVDGLVLSLTPYVPPSSPNLW